MGFIPKNSVAFAFGPVEGGTGRKHLRAGDLTEAVNVRQILTNEYRKRSGFDRAVPTADSGSFTAAAESLVSDGIRLISRDSTDTCWAEVTASNQRLNRGTAKRVYPDTAMAPLVASAVRSVGTSAGGYYWQFTIGSGSYSYTLWDPSTRTIFRGATQVTAASISHGAVVADSTNVWFFWITGAATTITCHKYTISSPGTAATSTTYDTSAAGNWFTIDADRFSNGDIAVVGRIGTGGGGRVDLRWSLLDTATGQAKAAPAPVTLAQTSSISGVTAAGVSILKNQAGSSNWYFASWRHVNASNNLELILQEVNFSTLASVSTVVLETPTGTGGATGVNWGACMGWLAGNGDRVVVASYDTYDSGTVTYPRPYVLTKYVRSGATTTTTIRRRAYVASKPVQFNSIWYYLEGYDDGPTSNLARNYYLVDESGTILTPAQHDFGFAIGAGAKGTATTGRTDSFLYSGAFQTQSNRIDFLGLTQPGGGAASDYAPTLMSCDFAATWGPPTRLRQGIVVYPGGIPTRTGASDALRELTPLLFPPPIISFTNGAGAPLGGATTLNICYALIDTDGTMTLSTPSAAQTNTFNNGTGQAIGVAPLTHLLSGTSAYILVFLSSAGSTQPMLQNVVANDPTVDTQTININPVTVTTGDTVYTFGGGLANLPAPASRAVGFWQRRLMLASGTDLWVSQERFAQTGPQLNPVLLSSWEDGEGDILALTAIDWNSFALFKKDSVGVIQGAGPDGRGSGNYLVQTLRTKKGPVNVRSVATGPNGAYFQAMGDGRIYSVTPALEIQDITSGMEAYRSETVSAALWVEAERHMRFFTSGPRVLVLDYAHPSDSQPQGRWYSWSSANLLQAYGAAVDSSGTAYHIESSGTLRKPGSTWVDAGSGSSVPVLMKLVTGDLAAAGQLQGEYRLALVHFLGKFIGPHALRMTVDSDFGDVVTFKDKDVITIPSQFSYPPPGHHRVQATRVTVEELSNANGTEGFVLEGLSLTVQPRSKTKPLSVSQRI